MVGTDTVGPAGTWGVAGSGITMMVTLSGASSSRVEDLRPQADPAHSPYPLLDQTWSSRASLSL